MSVKNSVYGMQVLSDDASTRTTHDTQVAPTSGCKSYKVCLGPECKGLGLLCLEGFAECPHNRRNKPMINIGKPVTLLGVLSGQYMRWQEMYEAQLKGKTISEQQAMTSEQQYL